MKLGSNLDQKSAAASAAISGRTPDGEIAPPPGPELYHLAARDEALRRRILGVMRRVPLPCPAFWLAALASLGEAIDWTLPRPHNGGSA